ncbi:hypothetical protein OEZ86_006289 [Tetradesmus obliquus]|nr:hypothetical protein OEZ86_006289 [Tetradesmus obliquus]
MAWGRFGGQLHSSLRVYCARGCNPTSSPAVTAAGSGSRHPTQTAAASAQLQSRPADTPGGQAFISPAKSQGICSACVGFAITAAAEAAINVYKQQSWDKLSLSEQDLSFCKAYPRINCDTGGDYDSMVRYINEGQATRWAARSCFGYKGYASKSCDAVAEGGECTSQLPAGGVLSVAYGGSALTSMPKMKEQIMLAGGVFTSMAMSKAAFGAFSNNKTADNGVFNFTEDPRTLNPGNIIMHAVFCYGWWDNPANLDDGYWLCKNSWSSAWGLHGSFKVAYGVACIMQPDYTFALQFGPASAAERSAAASNRLLPSIANDPAHRDCVIYKPQQPQRLAKLADELTTMAVTYTQAQLGAGDILASIVASNLHLKRNMSAASKGPFTICGAAARLIKAAQPSSPSPPPGDVIDVAAGEYHVCALVSSSGGSGAVGDVFCWGADEFGQLGQGYANGTWDAPGGSMVPLRVTGLRNATAIFGGFDSMCAVLLSRKVMCWGANDYGMLGIGGSTVEPAFVPKAMQGVFA